MKCFTARSGLRREFRSVEAISRHGCQIAPVGSVFMSRADAMEANMNAMRTMVEWVDERPAWQKWTLAAGVVAAVVVTGGVAAAAIAEGGFIVVAGDVMVAAGPVAVAMVV